MCQIKQEPSSSYQSTSSTASTPSSSTPPATAAGRAAKRPAGRTKFRETRHPVFRGVRRRGRAGGRCRWVCEVRVPGRRGCRLWLGTFDSPDAAARAHDAAMLALRGACGAAAAGCLNFPDSAWLLDVPPLAAAIRGEGVRRAVARAVEGFLLRARPAAGAEDAMSATSGTSATPAAAADDDDDGDDASSSSAKSDGASPFEMDVMSDMGAGLYYASMAQGLLVEPPASDESWSQGSDDCDVAVVPLWSY
ncbi:unnamed protein product [Urochloa humidicola]